MDDAGVTGTPPDVATHDVATHRAHPARAYDWYLGGKDNFEADREMGRKTEQVWPTVRVFARENRKFMNRAVRYLAAEEGVSQFLDIGSGMPTKPNVHEVAQQVLPESRVVYVDYDHIRLGCVHWSLRYLILRSSTSTTCVPLRVGARDVDVDGRTDDHCL